MATAQDCLDWSRYRVNVQDLRRTHAVLGVHRRVARLEQERQARPGSAHWRTPGLLRPSYCPDR